MGFGVSIADLKVNHDQMLFRRAGILEAINYTQFPEQDPFKDLLTRSKIVAAFRNFCVFKLKF